MATQAPVRIRPAPFKEPVDAYAETASLPFPFLLESRNGGRFSYVGADPYAVIVARGTELTEWREGRATTSTGDPFDLLRRRLQEFAAPYREAHLPFWGGAVGYLGYDLAHHLERLPRRALVDRGWPDTILAFHDRVTVIDHEIQERRDVELTRRTVGRAIGTDLYRSLFKVLPTSAPSAPRSNFNRERYLDTIRRTKEHIAAGDAYQVNLSQRFTVNDGRSPLDLYRELGRTSPSPYSALLDFGSRSLISSSPELFLERRGSRVVTRPIKGTRRRGTTPEEDQRLAKELLASPKDDAELTMIVDLERNDLGRVCEVGSVRTTSRKTLETHPNVHHLVATVEGTLRKELDAVDLLRATFPSGSVTGAPKIRAMEIIDELEPTRRAAYTGAIGWIGFNGDLSLSIAIRTIERHGSRLDFQAGGGIVADSDPAAEYQETYAKASGIARALGVRLP